MPATDETIDSVVRHQVFLERYKKGEVEANAETLKKLEEIEVDLIRKLESDKVSQLTRKELNDLLKNIRKAESSAYAEIIERTLQNSSRLATAEAGFEVALLEAVILNQGFEAETVDGVFSKILRKPLSTGNGLLEPYLRTWSKAERTKLPNAILKAHNEGQTIQQMVRVIRGTRANRFNDGITKVRTRHAEAVARTAIQHISNTARAEVWSNNKDVVVAYEWVAVLDSRTTQQCKSLDGENFFQGEGPLPPIHVKCRSTTAPVIDERFDFLKNNAQRSAVGAEGTETAGGKKGGQRVSAALSYYEWLKSQPASFQDEAMGPTRAKLFRDGGLSLERFRALQIDKVTFRPLTLDEMKILEPLAFERAGI